MQKPTCVIRRSYSLLLGLLLLAACSTSEKIEGETTTSAVPAATVPAGSDIVEAKPASLAPVTPPTANMLRTQSTDSDGMAVALKPDTQAAKTPPLEKEAASVNIAAAISGHAPHEETPAKATGSKAKTEVTHKAPEGTDPHVALGWLKNGNIRFAKGRLRKDGQSKKDIQRLAKGQKPHTIVLSCSDSRVPPEIVFDQKLGEIFTVRTAGEALSPSAIASIEYAVEHLGSRLILVMGHTSCGAVKAAASLISGGDAGSENLNELVADIQPRIREVLQGKRAPSSHFETESWANTKGVAKDLTRRSSILAKAIESGRVKIVSALYSTEVGTVQFDGN